MANKTQKLHLNPKSLYFKYLKSLSGVMTCQTFKVQDDLTNNNLLEKYDISLSKFIREQIQMRRKQNEHYFNFIVMKTRLSRKIPQMDLMLLNEDPTIKKFEQQIEKNYYSEPLN